MTKTYIVRIDRTAKLAPSTLLSTITDALNGITSISVVDVDDESHTDTEKSPMSRNLVEHRTHGNRHYMSYKDNEFDEDRD